jgi:hypothetical protein
MHAASLDSKKQTLLYIAFFLKPETPSPARLSQTAQESALNLAAIAEAVDVFWSARRPVGMIGRK